MEMLFRKMMEKGKVRPCDPRALSTLFVANLVYWYFETFIFNYGVPQDASGSEELARTQIRLIADLVRPCGGRS
jgi:hypothetical protein